MAATRPAAGSVNVRSMNTDAITGGVNSNVNSYTPYFVRISRKDTEQEITSYSLDLPKGITGKLAGIPFCPEAAIAAARVRRGFDETAAPSCPQASQVGRTLTGYGVGSALTYAPGRIYLAGPYQGQPLSLVTVNAAGLSSQDTVNVLPLAFAGAGSTASPQVGQSFTLNSTAVLKFDASSDIDFGDGVHGILTTNTPDALTVIVPQPDVAQPAALTVTNVAVTFAPGSLFDLPTADLFDVVNPYDPNDTCGSGVAVGEGEFYDGFASGEADNYYTFTVPAGGAVVDFLLQWDGAADIDVLMFNAACDAFIGGFGGATGNNPEDFSMVLPEGTHNLLINLYDAHDDVPHLYKMTINFN